MNCAEPDRSYPTSKILDLIFSFLDDDPAALRSILKACLEISSWCTWPTPLCPYCSAPTLYHRFCECCHRHWKGSLGRLGLCGRTIIQHRYYRGLISPKCSARIDFAHQILLKWSTLVDYQRLLYLELNIAESRLSWDRFTISPFRCYSPWNFYLCERGAQPSLC